MAGITFFDSKECEWADMSIFFAGAPLVKVTGIRYKASKVKNPYYGAGDGPLFMQSGNRAYEGQMTVYKGALDNMNAAAVAAGGVDVLDMKFDIVVTYKPAAGRPLQTDTLIGVEIKEYEKGWDQGAETMPITLPMGFLGLKSA